MKTLLLDIETAPNVSLTWGLFNQNISLNQLVDPGYTLCFAAKWKGKRKVTFRSTHENGELAMLDKAHEMMSEADAVVHYNGKKFDIPTLNSEFLKHNYSPPPPQYQVDLYHTVKQNFRLTSNKLDFVARHLGIEGKEQHKGMAMWVGCMHGKKDDLNMMKSYNIQDVNLLDEVHDRLQPWINNGPNLALYEEGNVPMCPTCAGTSLQARGTYKTKTMSYQRYQCQGCGSWSKERKTNLSSEKRKSILIKI